MSNNQLVDVHAFTAKYNGCASSIVVECGISKPFTPALGISNPEQIYPYKALWDTGASNCVITQKTASDLGLQPISMVPVNHAGGQTVENVYLVNIYLPNNIILPNLRVTECRDTSGHFGLIIGMDVITLGDFSISNFNGKTTFSFRMPSIEEIDLSKQPPPEAPKLPYTAPAKVGRNDICPCGSGKKYKNCHGKPQ